MVVQEGRYVVRRLGSSSVQVLDKLETDVVYLSDCEPGFVTLTRSQLELLKTQVDEVLGRP